MVTHICPRCGYATDRKNDFNKHLTRKKPCDAIKVDKRISKKTTSLNNEISKNKTEQSNDQSMLSPNSKGFYECIYCSKSYTRKDNLKRHFLTCPKLKQYSDSERELLIKSLNPSSKLDTVAQPSNPTVINFNTHIDNLFININSYQKTDYSHLTDDDYMDCMDKVSGCVRKLIDMTHFNPSIPQNHNIYINSIHSKYALIHNGNSWEITDQNEMIDDLIDQSHCLLDIKSEQLFKSTSSTDLNNSILKKFEKYVSQRDNAAVIKKVRNEVKLLLFNKRFQVMNCQKNINNLLS